LKLFDSYYQTPFFCVQIAQNTLNNWILQSKNSMMVFGKSTKVLGDFSSYIIIAYKFVEGYKVESFTTSLTGRCRRCKARRHVSLNQSARRNLPAADPENLSQFHKKTLPPRPIPVWHINSSWRVRAPQEETYIVSDECARARHRAHLTWKLKLVRRPGGPFLPTGPSLSASVDRYAFSCSRDRRRCRFHDFFESYVKLPVRPIVEF